MLGPRPVHSADTPSCLRARCGASRGVRGGVYPRKSTQPPTTNVDRPAAGLVASRRKPQQQDSQLRQCAPERVAKRPPRLQLLQCPATHAASAALPCNDEIGLQGAGVAPRHARRQLGLSLHAHLPVMGGSRRKGGFNSYATHSPSSLHARIQPLYLSHANLLMPAPRGLSAHAAELVRSSCRTSSTDQNPQFVDLPSPGQWARPQRSL